MQTIYNKILDETCFEATHDSGLTVRIVKKPSKTRKTAMLAANFGSIDCEFEYDGKKVKIPNGTAHFLEHKLFEGKNGNAFDYYAKTGAKANAYTSSDRTVYYFTCTDKFEKCLEILLSFVYNPYLTDENVEKEKGIIGQEIRMYEDDPEWQGYYGTICSLYSVHPVKNDIAGTVEDIAPITVDTLTSCYDTFYHPSNMVLTVVGDVDENKVMELCDKIVPKRPAPKIKRNVPDEPQGVVTEYFEKAMVVSRPIFNIGIKDNDVKLFGYELAKKEIEAEMLLEMLFGASTPFYKELYDSGVINAEFCSEYCASDTYAFCLLAGESDAPEKVKERAVSEIESFLKNGVDKERFVRIRNTMYGELVSSFDDVSRIGSALIKTHLFGCEPFVRAQILSEITEKDIENRARALFCPLNMTLSVIVNG